MFKRDNLRFGMLLGFLAPVVGLFVYYLLAFMPRNVGFTEFIGYMRTYKSLLTAVSSLSLVANAILFTVYINTRRDKMAKGVFIATLIYGVAVLLLKLVG
ncbi:MAG TPA: hypothetical protein PLQ65_11020 [Flavihumibacter sp.]|nr:hypothetical protein [Flavihumibacter sp.]HQD10187.1 hypothetical protein [Flavihumibacter sp.]